MGGRGEGLPARIWLTGDWEGALGAHVTINNPAESDGLGGGVLLSPRPVVLFGGGWGGHLTHSLRVFGRKYICGVCRRA